MLKTVETITIYLLVLAMTLMPTLTPMPAFAEETSPLRKIVILAVEDGKLDAESVELAKAMQYLLSGSAPLEVLSDKDLFEPLKYHVENKKQKPNPFEDSLTSAKQHYLKADFKEARQLAELLIQDLEQVGDLSKTGSLLSEAYLTKALCDWAFRNKNAVKDSFLKILSVHPTYQLDASLFSPALVYVFEESRSEVFTKPTGQIKLNTVPAGAEVILNGVKECVTPCRTITMPVGTYFLEFRLNRYANATETVQIEPEKMTQVLNRLEWKQESEASSPLNLSAIIKENDETMQIKEASLLGEKLKLFKVVLVNAEPVSEAKGQVFIRIVDVRNQAGQVPLSFNFSIGKKIKEDKLESVTLALLDQIFKDVSDNPARYSDPKGFGNIRLLGKKRKKLTKQPAFWAVVGGVILTGVLLGIFAGGRGKEISQPQDTKIKLRIE